MNKNFSLPTGVILAGGQSRRFGRNKALASYRGVPLLQWVVRALTPWVENLYLVTNRPEDYPSFPGKIITDSIPYQGPVGGLATAFQHLSSEQALVMACDLPRLPSGVLPRLLAEGCDSDALAVIPVDDSGPQFLCGLYRRKCGLLLEKFFARGGRSLKDFLQGVPEVRWLPFEGMKFSNINTQQELFKLEKQNA